MKEGENMNLKPIEGLDKFMYPKKAEVIQKEIEESIDKSKMKEFCCTIHMLFFWRNIKINKGHCGLCKKFIPKIHVPYMEYKEGVDEMVKAKRSVSIEDGKHIGIISKIEERTEPYEYTDIYVKLKIQENEVEIKYGCPTAISLNDKDEPTTKLTKVLMAFGMKIEVNKEITIEDMKKALINKKCAVLIENKPSKEGTFANIVSLKPEK